MFLPGRRFEPARQGITVRTDKFRAPASFDARIGRPNCHRASNAAHGPPNAQIMHKLDTPLFAGQICSLVTHYVQLR